MNNLKLITILSAVACLAGVRVAEAQTPANMTIVSGNGQAICFCQHVFTPPFSALQVLVTDAAGNPLPNVTVTWNLDTAFSSAGLSSSTSTTDATGIAFTNLLAGSSLFNTGFGQAPVQYQVTATASGGSNPSATFTETQAFLDSGVGNIVTQNINLPVAGETISGKSGASGYTLNGQQRSNFQIKVFSATAVLPGVSVRLVSNQTSPSISCASGPGADPGSVLTDSTGVATCTPIFSGSGSGSFYFVIGGVAPTDPTVLTGLFQYPAPPLAIKLTVQPGVPTTLTLTSGNNQSANAGQIIGQPLVVTVSGSSGPLAGQTVNWTVSPSGSAALSNATSTTDVNGQARTTVTLASGAAGVVTVTARVANSSIAAQNFTLTAVPLVSVTGVSIVSGNNQSVLANSNFTSPIVVQVNGSNGPLANVPVSFTVTSGTATVSQSSVNTGSNGQASVNVTAGNTVGNITVVATANGFSQTFNLAISPPGPNLTSGTFVNAADQQRNSLSPCSLATIIAAGIAPSIQGVSPAPIVGPLPALLGTDTLTISGTAAPILSVANQNGQQQLTFQVPCSIQPGSNPITVAVGAGSATSTVNILPASPGIFQTVMSDGVTRAVLVRPDGSFVSLSNPARRGEHIIAYVTGLGPTTPSVNTNSLPIPGQTSNVNYNVIVGVNNAGVPLDYARLSEDLVGVYVVSFQIPTDAPVSNNVVFSVGVAPQGSGTVYYSAGSSIPIA